MTQYRQFGSIIDFQIKAVKRDKEGQYIIICWARYLDFLSTINKSRHRNTSPCIHKRNVSKSQTKKTKQKQVLRGK